MKLLTSFIAFALLGLLVAAPASNDDDEKLVISKDFYAEVFVKYKSNHDIVNLLVPLNSLNFDENDNSTESNELDADITVFFVEADVQSDGSRVDQGLYVLKEGKSKKILDNGRDAAASSDSSKEVFFGAKDGIYVYNQKTNSADKYGSITDSIIGIAKEKEGDVIYILTDDRDVYKVTNNGETKEKIKDIVNAQQIILDYSNNIYFYSDDKKPYVRTADGVKKVEGLPESYNSVNLIKPPFYLDDGVPFVVDNVVYILHANGTSEISDFSFEPNAKPSAYAPEATLIQYYAYNKKIYEYNILTLMLGEIFEELGNYLQDKGSEIRVLASKSKGSSLRKSKA